MKKHLVAAAVLATLSSTAAAEVRINGFANLVGGMTSSDDSLYGYDDDISFSPDSLFALQLSGDVNDKMSATVQLVARGDEDYDVGFEWAYFTYQASENVSISAGRLRLPLFRYSASLDVGYSQHWIAAPDGVYNVPANNIDGVRVDYSTFSGDWEINLQGAFGTFQNPVFGGDFEGKNTHVVTLEATYEWLKLRGVYGAAKSTLTGPADLDGAFQALGAASPDLGEFLRINDNTATFTGFGVEIDNFDWFIGSEYTIIKIEDSFFPDQEAFYVTAGIRSGKWTPSLTYETFDSVNDVKGTSFLSGFPAEAQAQLLPVVAGVQLSAMDEYDVITGAVRYDWDTNVAVKADISRYSDELNDGNDATLVRVAVNYVF